MNEWDQIIKPRRSWFDIDLRAIWRYRDLCMMYVKRNFITTYKQTILGPLWFLIAPIFTIVIYMFIFGGLAGISTEGIPQPLFYMAGILLWNYFTECFGASSNVFVSNANVFGKVWFPRLVVPISGCITALFKMGVQALLFVVIYIACSWINPDLRVNIWVLFTPVLIGMLALHAMSWGLIVSSITYKYRDLQVFIGFVLQLFMYMTPVVYPLETIPEEYKHIVMLNPLSSIFETFKYGCFNVGILDWWGLLYSFMFMLVVTTFSILIFNRAEQTFMDTV
ncbi:MAG: ABC transporter permease [Muribaculaceae bacterium]|nr:ABC transporter permease [Muribaculaceae bacterium]